MIMHVVGVWRRRFWSFQIKLLCYKSTFEIITKRSSPPKQLRQEIFKFSAFTQALLQGLQGLVQIYYKLTTRNGDHF